MISAEVTEREIRGRWYLARLRYDRLTGAWPDPEKRTPEQREQIFRAFYVLSFLTRARDGEIEATPAALETMRQLLTGVR